MGYKKKEHIDFLSIESEEDYHSVLNYYLKICRAPEGSPEWAEAELLKVFIEEYEKNECDGGVSDDSLFKGEC